MVTQGFDPPQRCSFIIPQPLVSIKEPLLHSAKQKHDSRYMALCSDRQRGDGCWVNPLRSIMQCQLEAYNPNAREVSNF